MEDKFHQPADIVVPQCHECLYWIPSTTTCKAYPEGIPMGILTNDLDHREPLDGDHGIQFQQASHARDF